MNDKLPEAPKAAGNYVTVKKIGDFIYTSGHVPITDEKKIIGKIPNDISIRKGMMQHHYVRNLLLLHF